MVEAAIIIILASQVVTLALVGVNADGARRTCRVRTRADQGSHRRRAEACTSSGRQVRKKVQTHPTSNPRSSSSKGCRRSADGNRSKLQCQPFDNLSPCLKAAREYNFTARTFCRAFIHDVQKQDEIYLLRPENIANGKSSRTQSRLPRREHDAGDIRLPRLA
jgi:hypothetical protein